MRQFGFALGVAASILAASATARAEAAVQYRVVARSLNVRQAPRRDAPIVRSLVAEDLVFASSSPNAEGWLALAPNGYAAARFLAPMSKQVTAAEAPAENAPSAATLDAEAAPAQHEAVADLTDDPEAEVSDAEAFGGTTALTVVLGVAASAALACLWLKRPKRRGALVADEQAPVRVGTLRDLIGGGD